MTTLAAGTRERATRTAAELAVVSLVVLAAFTVVSSTIVSTERLTLVSRRVGAGFAELRPGSR